MLQSNSLTQVRPTVNAKEFFKCRQTGLVQPKLLVKLRLKKTDQIRWGRLFKHKNLGSFTNSEEDKKRRFLIVCPLFARGLENNYCRNPDNEKMPWCYTTDTETRWEYCRVPNCGDGARPSNSTTDTKRCWYWHLIQKNVQKVLYFTKGKTRICRGRIMDYSDYWVMIAFWSS